MLRWRLLLGVLLIASLVGLFWLDAHSDTPGAWLLPLAVIATVLATQEIISLLQTSSGAPISWVVYVSTLAMVLSNAVPLVWQTRVPAVGWPLATYGISLLLIFCGQMRRYQGPSGNIIPLALSALAVAYVGIGISMLVQLRLIGSGEGLAALATLILVVKLCDTGAYTCGRLFGRHKLVPLLSPGKTIEGAIGGIAWSLAGCWFAFAWLLPRMSERAVTVQPWGWLLYGLVIAVAGIAADLAESLIKRDAGRKDSSTWLPGFGGVLDLLDSLLLTGPLAYVCWLLVVR